MSQSTVINKKVRNKIPVKKIITAIAILLLIAVIAVVGFRYIKSKEAKNTVRQETAVVQKGDLSVTVSGSGPIRSANKYDITSNVSGTITRINFKDGDKVKAGDTLIQIDDQDARLKVKQIENSIAQAKLSQEYNKKYLNDDKLTSPISGEITDLQVKAGDNIAKNAVVMTITDKSKLKLLGSFSNSHRKDLHVGQEVTVNALDTANDDFYTVKGSISSIGAPSYSTGDGSEVYNVEVVVNNPGALKEGMAGNIVINAGGSEIKSTGSSSLYYIDSITIKSEAGGIVEKLNVEKGQIVNKGSLLAELQNDDLVLTSNTDDLKLQDLQIQLETAQEQLADYNIISPIDGTITFGEIKQGNSIKAGDSLGTIANYDTMEFDIAIDELDIAKIQAGQSANVTVDALPETDTKPIKGAVSKIAIDGTSSNGVTTYPVTVQLEPNGALKGGMNANAEITINSKSNVLYVPIQAVQKRGDRSYVMVRGTGGKNAGGNNTPAQQGGSNTNPNGSNGNTNTNANRTNNSNRTGSGNAGSSGNGNRNFNRSSGNGLNSQSYYQNAVMTPVTTGISNDEFIEIVTGLKEGEVVILPPTTSGQSTTQQAGPFGGGAAGGAAVRVPMGGGGGQNFRR